jgi:SOS-response transcriptional repressor LexA
MEQTGLSARKLGQKIGLENIYRVLDGERNWSFKHLLAVSELFGVPVEELVGGTIYIPIMASFSALEPPDYPEQLVSEKKIELKRGGRVGATQGLYALELSDRSMMPAFKPGTRFIAEKESSGFIEHEDLIVCPDDKGKAHVCRIYFTADQYITLKSLNPTVPDLVLPRNRIRACDLVVDIHLR